MGEYNGWDGPQGSGGLLDYGAAAPGVQMVGAPAPSDAANGAPAQYSQAVLEVFKSGLGAYVDLTKSGQQLQYAQYQATSQGLQQQGQAQMQYSMVMQSQKNFIALAVLVAAAVFIVREGRSS